MILNPNYQTNNKLFSKHQGRQQQSSSLSDIEGLCSEDDDDEDDDLDDDEDVNSSCSEDEEILAT